ncbi:helix-turn-helix domain-containing protein [Paractinoplanes abujensis]|uniref:Transcriptional regulator with XRE-family HTH domain n=1 Tax=Paractinoplanes abujensis TaxID=882441 RepID=A0A7W7CLH7_9ACTN|nr:helix-turn-helix transcriptional regulator [Actinoplanes abujensis]MBB4690677.1 transcriptional regulator with XRE-family HTH domain [Actinoplanes abujensis]
MPGPTLSRRRLGAELKRCREAAGLTQEQVSQRFEWHAAKVTRIETARVTVTPRDVKDLLSLYGVSDRSYGDALLALARSARQRAWWSEYRDLVQPDSYVSLESEAAAVLTWEPMLFPGLLQTEPYMRAVLAMTRSAARVDRAVALRLARQRRLTGDRPLQMVALLDESVIHRQIGGRAVRDDQLRHVLALSERPNVTVRLFPYGHCALRMSTTILQFDQADELNVVFVEGLRPTNQLLKQPAEVTRYRSLFDEVAAQSLDPEATRKTIEAELAGGPR